MRGAAAVSGGIGDAGVNGHRAVRQRRDDACRNADAPVAGGVGRGGVILPSVNGGLSEEEKAQWQLFSNRAERLHDHVEMLREYLVQIRELYQSLIAVQQNQVMSILTVVTTIFLPLTLIAGWYGMNFPNMPEFGWKYAYPAVIIVSILVIILEIIYFKKKKML